MRRRLAAGFTLGLLLAGAARALAQDGADVFRANCASCHGTADAAPAANAPAAFRAPMSLSVNSRTAHRAAASG